MAVQSQGYVQSETVAIVETGPAISWGAVIAGAVAAAALSLVLLAIGTAFGLSAISAWDTGEAAKDAAAAVGIGAIIFLLVVHGVSSGFGGYIAGRLRKKLTGVRGDETYFRDTAHGMLVWALSAVVGAVILAMLSVKLVSGGVTLGAAGLAGVGGAAGTALSQAGAMGGPGGQQSNSSGGPARDLEAYYVDTLFRLGGAATGAEAAGATGTGTTGTGTTGTGTTGTGTTGGAASTAAPAAPATPNAQTSEEHRREVGRILRVSVINGDVSAGDKEYLARLVAQETGLPQADASRRVDEVIGQSKAAAEKMETTARDAAETARQGARAGAIWSAIAMLVGAFCASLCATWGGRARDTY